MRIKQKYMIDFAKGVTWLLVLYLIYYYNQADNLTAWVYFCLHGSYGIMWVLKSYIFPDKTWESKVGIPYALLILICLPIKINKFDHNSNRVSRAIYENTHFMVVANSDFDIIYNSCVDS